MIHHFTDGLSGQIVGNLAMKVAGLPCPENNVFVYQDKNRGIFDVDHPPEIIAALAPFVKKEISNA